jgi:tetratricopeptide (TPR) repeat protein
MRMNQPREALAAFEQAVTLQPDFAAAWYDKGLALASMALYQEALDAIERALSMNQRSDWWQTKEQVTQRLWQQTTATHTKHKALDSQPAPRKSRRWHW